MQGIEGWGLRTISYCFDYLRYAIVVFIKFTIVF